MFITLIYLNREKIIDKLLNIIGTMSGTSLDGIDVSFIRSNGKKFINFNKNYYFRYNKDIVNLFKNVLINYKSYIDNNYQKQRLNKFVTNLHYKAIEESGFLDEAELIGFHGQTIFHNPQIRSVQIGEPQLLANLTKRKTIFNFRDNDILNNGEGAPIAPIFHKLLIIKNKIELPCCFLNIGGISNLSYWDGSELIGFDTGPGNNLMDDYVQAHTNYLYDFDGNIASKGKVNQELLEIFLSNNYFKKLYPKSVDKNFFYNEFKLLIDANIGLSNSLATLAEFTINTVFNSINSLPIQPKSIIISGGGIKNTYLLNKLKKKLKIKFYELTQFNHNPDFIESELIAFLSARCYYNLPITFPNTTGVLKPTNGGRIYKCL